MWYRVVTQYCLVLRMPTVSLLFGCFRRLISIRIHRAGILCILPDGTSGGLKIDMELDFLAMARRPFRSLEQFTGSQVHRLPPTLPQRSLTTSVKARVGLVAMWTAVAVFVSALTAPASSGGSPLPPFTCADLASNDTYHLSFQGSWTYRSLNPQVRKHSELLIIVIICLEYIYYKTEYVRIFISSCSWCGRYVWWKNSVCKIPARLTSHLIARDFVPRSKLRSTLDRSTSPRSATGAVARYSPIHSGCCPSHTTTTKTKTSTWTLFLTTRRRDKRPILAA